MHYIIEKISVSTKHLESFIKEITNEEIELLALDIEGLDSEILLDLDFNDINIKFLSFEYLHLGENKDHVLKRLKNNSFEFLGYGVDYNSFDYLYKKL